MPRKLTFIHTGDLHIGAPFRGLRGLSGEWAELLTEAIPAAWERIVDEACSRKVDFVIVAGDIFDVANASFLDYSRFFKGIERLSEQGIPTYLCTGNHDSYDDWRPEFYALGDMAFMFSADRPEFFLFERDGEPLCVLGGRGLLNKVSLPETAITEGITREQANNALGDRAAEAPFGVGVLHTGLDFDQKSAPRAKRDELLQAGFDYWALGHIHKRFVDDEDNTRISFCGNIQGRDIKETGRRGVNLVTLVEGAPNQVEFIPTAQVTWEQLVVDVEACTNLPDVVEAIKKEQFSANSRDMCERMVSRITLIGTTPLHEALRQPAVLEDIRNTVNSSYAEFFIDALIDRTTSPFDREALKTEGLFPATFLQAAEDMSENEEAVSIYLQDELMKKGVDTTSAREVFDHIDDLTAEAEDLVLDLLMQKEA